MLQRDGAKPESHKEISSKILINAQRRISSTINQIRMCWQKC